MTTAAERAFDPRPRLVEAGSGSGSGSDWRVAGGRCTGCGHASAVLAPCCARCGSELVAALFGPDGVAWATTTIHVAAGERSAPYTLAYVDLDDGPRLLAHVADGPAVGLGVGERVRLAGLTGLDDPQVEVVR